MGIKEKPRSILLNDADNVAVVIDKICEGEPIDQGNILAQEAIPAGHKVCTSPLRIGEPIQKYGQIIGFATTTIKCGDHVHVHNCEMGNFDRDYAFSQNSPKTQKVPSSQLSTFQGFRRSNGQVGTRNYLAVQPIALR